MGGSTGIEGFKSLGAWYLVSLGRWDPGIGIYLFMSHSESHFESHVKLRSGYGVEVDGGLFGDRTTSLLVLFNFFGPFY